MATDTSFPVIRKKSGMDDPKTIEGNADSWRKLINENLMPSPQVMTETGEDVLLGSGKIAMTTQGSWMLAAFRDNEYTHRQLRCRTASEERKDRPQRFHLQRTRLGRFRENVPS
jgi:hypothetical protein